MDNAKVVKLLDETLEHITLAGHKATWAKAAALSGDEPRVGPYLSPVGTVAERASGAIWPGDWVDANGYARWYKLPTGWAWHTGADLNLNKPHFDADAHAPVYSIGDGEVYAVGKYGSWGGIVCVRHTDCLSRYGHVEKMQVFISESVTRGQLVGYIGNAGGRFPYHLHFDIARLDSRMARVPGDWPGVNKERVLRDYYDPAKFLRGLAD